jgi:glycosyltransferase involved in cell wall biosynthesis
MTLLNDSVLREKMGDSARRRAESNYSLAVNLPTLVDLIYKVMKR